MKAEKSACFWPQSQPQAKKFMDMPDFFLYAGNSTRRKVRAGLRAPPRSPPGLEPQNKPSEIAWIWLRLESRFFPPEVGFGRLWSNFSAAVVPVHGCRFTFDGRFESGLKWPTKGDASRGPEKRPPTGGGVTSGSSSRSDFIVDLFDARPSKR